MSLIVRKRAYTALSRAALSSPYAKRARMAYSIGAYAFKNRRGIKRGARIVRRAYRRGRAKSQKFSRSNIGERVGTGTSKRSVTHTNDNIIRNTRLLYEHSLADIPEGTDLDARQRKMVNCRGFKICLELKNLINNPMYVNIAVVSPKDGQSNFNADWFRSSDASNRARNFDVTLNSNEFSCLPINSDAFTILKHKRFQLIPGSTTGSTASQSGRSYMQLKWWIPLKRQLRYDAAIGQPENGKVHLVYWFTEFATAANDPGLVGAVQMSSRVVAYFKEPKN